MRIVTAALQVEKVIACVAQRLYNHRGGICVNDMLLGWFHMRKKRGIYAKRSALLYAAG